MARTVADAAFLLSVIAGPDPAFPDRASRSRAVFSRGRWRAISAASASPTARILGGEFPVDPRVSGAIEAQLPAFRQLGCELTEFSGPPHGDQWALPDFSDADEIFKTMRAGSFHLSHGPLLAQHRHQMKDTIIWNIEEGEKLSGADLGRAEGETHRAVSGDARIYGNIRIPAAAGEPGPALFRGCALSDG